MSSPLWSAIQATRSSHNSGWTNPTALSGQQSLYSVFHGEPDLPSYYIVCALTPSARPLVRHIFAMLRPQMSTQSRNAPGESHLEFS